MFVSTLVGPPFEIRIEDNPDERGRMVLVELGNDPETTQVCSLKCGLSETIYEDEQVWEFAFSIVVVAMDEGCEPFETQDRQIAMAYIPDSIRHIVMDVTVESLKSLVHDVGPGTIYWVTKDIDPNEKALMKHYMLSETLEECGYRLSQDGTDQFGRRFWVMVRDGD